MRKTLVGEIQREIAPRRVRSSKMAITKNEQKLVPIRNTKYNKWNIISGKVFRFSESAAVQCIKIFKYIKYQK